MAQYEENILKYIDQLDESISADVDAFRIIDVRDRFYWFGFDTTGDFVFNKSFEYVGRSGVAPHDHLVATRIVFTWPFESSDLGCPAWSQATPSSRGDKRLARDEILERAADAGAN